MIDTQLPKATQFNTTGQKTLKEITSPVKDHLKGFRSFYKRALKTDVFLLDQMVRYLLRLKGKELRPTLVFMSARLFGDINERSYIAATMIELLHTATLIHDDVVDEADKRRGFLSINKIWKNKASVLLGDFLLSRGLLIALDNEEFKLLQVLSRAVKAMSEGELRQMKAAKLLNMTEKRYFEIIEGKTASLLSACCECGAISTSDDPEMHDKLSKVGHHIGMAFQIRDDLFDYGVDDVGKPRRNDIRERKVTLPLIKALEEASAGEKRHIKRLLRKRKKTDKAIDEIVDFVQEKGGLEHARTMMNSYTEEALKLLDELPDTEERRDLAQLIKFIITRKK